MLLALCACGSTADAGKIDEILSMVQSIQAQLDALTGGEAAETPADEAAEPAAVDFTWNGQMEVWSILPTTAAAGLVAINDAMGALMEAEGFTYVKQDAQGDPSAQVDFVEQAIAAGNVGAMMIAAMDVAMLEDAVKEAQDAGIAVAYLGITPDYDIGGYICTNYDLTGMYAVQAAEDWVTNRVAEGGEIPTTDDGKYEVAVDTYYDITDGVYRSNAIVGTVNASDILVGVSNTSSYGESNSYGAAFDNAQTVLMSNPNCHIFIAYEPEEALGAADAIEQYCDDNGLDLADYCVIPCYTEDDGTFWTVYDSVYDRDAGEIIDESASAIKGYATYGSSPEGTGEKLATILLGVCGEFPDYNWSFAKPLYDDTSCANIYGYSQYWVEGDDNPALQYRTEDVINLS